MYAAIGQIPTNGGYVYQGPSTPSVRAGVFGQVPTNGGYVVGAAARKPLFGMGQSECPPGEIGIPPFCVPNPLAQQPPAEQPPPPPSAPAPGPAPTCGPNQTEILGQCFNTPPCPEGEKEVLGVCYPDLGAQVPGAQPPPPTEPPPVEEPTKAGEMPDWVVPAVIGAGLLSLVGLYVVTRKKGRR